MLFFEYDVFKSELPKSRSELNARDCVSVLEVHLLRQEHLSSGQKRSQIYLPSAPLLPRKLTASV